MAVLTVSAPLGLDQRWLFPWEAGLAFTYVPPLLPVAGVFPVVLRLGAAPGLAAGAQLTFHGLLADLTGKPVVGVATSVAFADIVGGAAALVGISFSVADFLASLEPGGPSLSAAVFGGPDQLFGGVGPDRLFGRGGDDLVQGGEGADTLDGGPGDDSLAGQGGDDTLRGGDGSDRLDGGANFDTADYGALAAAVTVRFAPDGLEAKATGWGGTDSLVGVEAVRGGAGNDVFHGMPATGPTQTTLLDGGAGDDTLVSLGQLFAYDPVRGTGAAPVFDGGPGRDTADFSALAFAVLLDGDRVFGGGGGDDILAVLRGTELVRLTRLGDSALVADAAMTVDGGEGDDLFLVSAGLALGGPGNDGFDATTGAATVDGGEGEDVFYANPSGGEVDLGLGTASGGATLRGIEHAAGSSRADRLSGDAGANSLSGDRGDDILAGRGGDDELRGEGGDDTLLGGAGSNLLDGGTGSDWADWSGPGTVAPIFAELGAGLARGWGGTDTLRGIENLRGGGFADTLLGDAGPNSLAGGGGHDALFGGAADDVLLGEGGDDTLHGGTGADRMTGGAGSNFYQLDNAGDTIVVTPGAREYAFLLHNDAGSVTAGLAAAYLAEAASVATGGAGADVIAANPALASRLAGGGGDDELWGRGQADTLLGQAGDDALRGAEGDDVLAGGRGHNQLVGGAGADRFAWGEPAAHAPVTYDQVFDFDRAAGDRLVFYTAAPGASAASVLAGMAQVNIGADTALLVETLTGSFRIDLYGAGPITAADIVVVAAAFPADWL